MEIKREKKFSTRTLTVTAMFLAMNIIMSSSMLSVPVPGGHIYLNNAIITIASILLNPLCAFIVGGIGAFIGDLLFYPAPMFVSIVTHGIQAIVVLLCARKLFRGRQNECGCRDRRHSGHCYKHCRLLTRQSVHLFNSRICSYETAVSDTGGCCGFGAGLCALLCMQESKNCLNVNSEAGKTKKQINQ